MVLCSVCHYLCPGFVGVDSSKVQPAHAYMGDSRSHNWQLQSPTWAELDAFWPINNFYNISNQYPHPLPVLQEVLSVLKQEAGVGVAPAPQHKPARATRKMRLRNLVGDTFFIG